MAKPKRKFNAHPFAYHEVIEVEVTTLTNRGSGLGRIRLKSEVGTTLPDSGAGGVTWVVMIPFALPGERVRARVFRNHPNYSEADLIEVVRASPDRVSPRCPLFGRCGGCQYQNLAYARQLEWKQRQVAELLQHLAGVEFPVAPVRPSPREYGYRSKITPHFAALRRGQALRPSSGQALRPSSGQAGGEGGPPIGFLRQGTRFDIVDVPQCPIATPAINAALPAVRADVRRRLEAGEYKRGATLLLRDAGGEVTTDYAAVITERVGELQLRFLARDFFQNNPFLLPDFTQYVKEQAAAGGARFLVDAYCGSGLFALAAATAFEQVLGIEVSESSVAFARENARANGINRAEFQVGDSASIFSGLVFPPDGTAVIIDPPRKGCEPEFLRQLMAFGPGRIIYVSCDPSTQMRDLKGLRERGYRLAAVQPFDLFPQTRHLECVMTLILGET